MSETKIQEQYDHSIDKYNIDGYAMSDNHEMNYDVVIFVDVN